MPSHTQDILIRFAYAPTPEQQLYTQLEVAQGTRLIEALALVGWLEQFPELADWCETHKDISKVDNKSWRVGVFSYKKPLQYVLQQNDRIEVYRPLLVDPMHKRKKRAILQ